MKYDVFISYSRKDYAEEIINEKGEKEERIIPGNIVSQIIKYLKKNKISYWWDEYGMYSSDEFIEILAEHIAESRILLFISTENSNASKWTPKEISSALHLEKKVIPFRVDNSKYSNSVLFLISDIDFIDYSKDKKKAFKKLEVSIKKILEDERLRLEEERKRKEEEERRRQEEEEKKKEKEINKPIKKDYKYYAKTRHWSVNVLLCGMFGVAFGFGVLAYLLKEMGEINKVEMWLYVSLAAGGVAGLLDILQNNKRGVYILLSLMVIPLCVFIMGYAHTRIFTIPIVFLLSIYIILICIMPIKKNGIRAYDLLEKGRCWISKSRPRDNANVFPYVLFIIFLIAFIHVNIKYKFFNCGGGFKEGMMAVGKYDKWGFIDMTGNIVVPFKYDDAGHFFKGLALVKKDGKWGYVDKTGKEVIPCIYDYASDFSEGLASVEKDGKWGYVDKTGKEIAPCIYDYASGFSEGLASVEKDGKWGFIDKTGKEIVPCIYDDAGWFSKGLARVKKDGKWGFIDKTGKEIVPCIYDDAGWFSEGLARVKKDGNWGFIGKTGKEVSPCIYDYAGSFTEGMARVGILSFDDLRFGFIDTTGRKVVSCEYQEASDFSEGLAAVKKYNDKWGFIDKTGKEVIPCEYDKVEYFSEGLARVKKDREVFIIDKEGNRVID
ncbi:MAG: WG repeat-containing protein [Flavobacteriales bacterium]|nr:WG repeat-containing protein [Flavobacteriales bacterium]